MDYETLLPAYWRDKPKAMGRFQAVLRQVTDMMNCLQSFLTGFDLDRAVGKQLDMIGAWVGADRVLPFSPVSSAKRMNDADYRMYIRAKIAQNMWDGTNESAESMFRSIFPSLGIVLDDHQDMTVNIVLKGNFTELQIEMINAGLLIPHPAGVTVTYEIPQTIVSTDITIHAGVYQAGSIALLKR